MKGNNFNLTRQFVLLSFLCIVLIAAVSVFMLTKLNTEKILLGDATLCKNFVESVIAAEGTWGMFLDTPTNNKTSHKALESFFSHVAHMPDVEEAVIYSRNLAVLWSSNPNLIREHSKHNKELNVALQGEMIFYSGIISAAENDEHSHFDKNKRGMRYIKTYIPIWNKDHSEVVGVVGLYRIPTVLHQSIMETERFVWLGALTGGLLLFISLYWIVNRATLVMKNQQQSLSAAKSLSMIGQTAAALTHAMRNPLASIRACAELSLTDSFEGMRESAIDIMSVTDRLDRRAVDFLQFSMINNDPPECLNINNLVKIVIEEFEQILNCQEISVHLDMAEAQLPVEVHFTPLSQVFENLIMNAVEAMGAHGELIITTCLDSHRNKIIVSVTDNGPGLSNEYKDRIFQPFETTKPTGTGLGLALSRRLVEHYNGTLEINSKPGQGVTAVVCLPMSGGPIMTYSKLIIEDEVVLARPFIDSPLKKVQSSGALRTSVL